MQPILTILPRRENVAALPLGVVQWTAMNSTDRPIEVAALFTLSSPFAGERMVFDLQHDNLCVCGALGNPERQERVALAAPDLHGEGGWEQGIEPFDEPAEFDEIVEEFQAEGSVGPRNPGKGRNAMAAWVRYTLPPGGRRSAPFCIAWTQPDHEPVPWRYQALLSKRREDNAVVWIAERPFILEEDGSPSWQNWRDEAACPTHADCLAAAWLRRSVSHWGANGTLHGPRVGNLEGDPAYDMAWSIAREQVNYESS